MKLIKGTLKIDNLTLYIHKKRKLIFKHLYRCKYGSKEIIKVMKEMGMKEGSVVMVHSSMTEFYNYTDSAKELIDAIIEAIGPSGTLIMPAYPKIKFVKERDLDNPTWVDFDVNTTSSGAGYLTEVFRQYPGVRRSINIQHSVCAIGALADYFVSEHHLSQTAWDEYSPYYKLYLCDGLVFTFGLPEMLPTVHHCTESLLRHKYAYFNSFFNKEICYRYRDGEGNTGTHKMLFPDIDRKRRKKKFIEKWLDPSLHKKRRLSNLHIEAFSARNLLQTLIAHAEEGEVIYIRPSSKEYRKDGMLLSTGVKQ